MVVNKVTNNIYVLLIPSLNPDNKLLNLIKAIQNQSHQFEIIIVDDGSSHEFQPIFKEIEKIEKCTLLKHQENIGKGKALKTGMKYINEHFSDNAGIITADSDGQHSPSDILKIAKAITKNPDSIILGARDFSSKNVPFKNRFGNKITSSVFKL